MNEAIITLNDDGIEFYIVRLESYLDDENLKNKINEHKFNFNPIGNIEQNNVKDIFSLYKKIPKNRISDNLELKINEFVSKFSSNCYRMFLKESIKEKEVSKSWLDNIIKSGIKNDYIINGLLKYYPNDTAGFIVYDSIILPSIKKLNLSDLCIEDSRNKLHNFISDNKNNVRIIEGSILLLSFFGNDKSKEKINGLLPYNFSFKNEDVIIQRAIKYTYTKLSSSVTAK